MKKQVLIGLVFAFLMIKDTLAQNTPSPQIRRFDEEKLKQVRQNPNFNYEEDIDTYHQYDQDWEYKRWRWEEEQRKRMLEDKDWEIKKTRPQEGLNINPNFNLGESAIYIAAAILIIFLLLALLGIDLSSLFRKNKPVVEHLEQEDWQHLDKSNIDQLIEQAIAQEHYDQAIRYAFLKSLHLLGQKGYLQLQEEKTNAEYQKELSKLKKNMLEQFKWQSRIFAYVKYGEFRITKSQFEKIYPQFQSFYESI